MQAVSDSSGSPILTLTQTDTYVVGNEYYRTDMTLTNNTAEPLPAKLYHAADCYLQGSDSGFGFVDTNTHAVACAKNPNDSPPELIEEFAPLTAAATTTSRSTGTSSASSASRWTFPTPATARPSQDNGMGINWTTDLAPAAQQTFSMLSNFSNAGVLSPAVTAISPASGPSSGGTSVTITGTNLTGANAVSFGSKPASSFMVDSDTQITATAPAGTGTVDVTVTTPSGASSTVATDKYTYTETDAPVVSSVTPSSGPTAGGTSVTITGTSLANATDVKFGANSATITSNTATQIVATAPAGVVGTVDITVTAAGGTSSTGPADRYSYAARPAVTAINPTSGPTAGGTSVTITGTSLANATDVKFGANSATITSNTATQIVATAPAGVVGTVDITVTAAGGTSSTGPADRYSYAARPAVTAINPTSGPTAGGTSVTITGTSLANATDVKFGANSATITSNTATQIVATAPAGVVGTVDITVTAAGGTSSTGPADRYSYAARPAVTAINPTSGPTAGGTSVTITGTSLANATDVKFGANSATITSNTATQIVATAPAGVVGTVDITVTAAGGTSSTGPADRYSYAARPAVTAINPTSGPTAGGTSVTITGTSLANATDVKFGANSATITSNTATQIVATAPAGVVGTVDITVTAAGGTSSTGPADRYSYAARPAVTAINPTSGPTAGGTSVTITGTSLANATDVKFGANSATITSNTATQIVATAPAGVVGTVDITVTAAGGTSSTGPADRYSYMAPPPPPPPTTKPSVLGSNGSSSASAAAGFTGDVNPGGLPTTAHFEYGLDSRYTSASTSGPVYDQSTPNQAVGSDFSSHPITESVSGLVPNALYHVRLVATNSAGTTLGPDVTFTTPKAALPSQPSLGKSFNVSATGLVLILVNGKFVPLTQLSQDPQRRDHQRAARDADADQRGHGRDPARHARRQEGQGQEAREDQDPDRQVRRRRVQDHPDPLRPGDPVAGRRDRQGSTQLRKLQDQEGQSRHRRAIQQDTATAARQRPRQVPHQGPLQRGDDPRHDLDDRRPLRRHPRPRHQGHRHRRRLRPAQDHRAAPGPQLPGPGAPSKSEEKENAQVARIAQLWFVR